MSDGLIVQKYGGSSLDSPEKIRAVAYRIAERAKKKNRIIVIVSAMGKTTDGLMALAHAISPNPPRRELDMLLTVGERISMALLSMALNDAGIPAISFTGSQSGIVTSSVHTGAVIEEIRAQRILEALDEGRVTIVAGFQGVSRNREITTLGRGGSDTTAVALASSLGALKCEIYSDYPGLFTADPRLFPAARRIHRISHDEMLELASLGAKVLHFRAADLARKNGIPLLLLSSSEDTAGTIVDGEPGMESLSVKSITSSEEIGFFKVSFEGSGGQIRGLSRFLKENAIRLVFYQRCISDGITSVLFVVEKSELAKLENGIAGLNLPSLSVEKNIDVASVSVVGCGFSHKPDVVSDVERLLSNAGITPLLTWSSSLSATSIINKEARKEAVGLLHSFFFPGRKDQP